MGKSARRTAEVPLAKERPVRAESYLNRVWSIPAFHDQGEDAREALGHALFQIGDPEIRSDLLDVYDQIPTDQVQTWPRTESGESIAGVRVLRESAPGLLLRRPSRLKSSETCFYCGDASNARGRHTECDVIAVAEREHVFMKCITCSNEHYNVDFREHEELGLSLTRLLCEFCGGFGRNVHAPSISVVRSMGRRFDLSSAVAVEPSIPAVLLRFKTDEGRPFSICISCGAETTGDPGIWTVCGRCPAGEDELRGCVYEEP
ncbi:hypothetical protein ACSW29_27340 [Rhodococcus sp. GB-02]